MYKYLCAPNTQMHDCTSIPIYWHLTTVNGNSLQWYRNLYIYCSSNSADYLKVWARQMVIHTYILTLHSRVLLEKLISFQPVKKFPAFYGTWEFITAFTSAHHTSLSLASPIQSIPSHPTSWRSILILSSHLHLGLPSGLFPSGFPTKTLYMPLLSPIVLHALPISFFSNLSP